MSRVAAALVVLVLVNRFFHGYPLSEQAGVCTARPAEPDAGQQQPASGAAPECSSNEHIAGTYSISTENVQTYTTAEDGAHDAVAGDADADQLRTELVELLAQAKAAVASLNAATNRLERLLSSNAPGASWQVQQPDTSARSGSPADQPLRSVPTTTGNKQQPTVRSVSAHPADAFLGSSAEGSVATYDGWQRLLARGRRAWPEFFSLVAAVKADSDVTAMHSMYENSYYGTYRYLVLGDAGGQLYFLGPQAEVLLEYDTGTRSAVTAITSYALDHSTTLVATGHRDGELRHHLLRDKIHMDSGGGTIYNVTLHATVPHPYSDPPEAEDEQEEPPSIVMLDVHQQQLASCTVVVDGRGSHRMVHPDGTVRFTTRSNGTAILAARKGRTVTTMAVADGIWVGVAPPYEHIIRKLPCAGLNGTSFLAAAFDVVRPYLLYAITDDGQLLTLLAPTDNRVDNCTIWAQRPLVLPPGRVQLLSVKSYLLLAHELGVAVFNVTAAQPTPPVDVLVEPVGNLAAVLGGSMQRVERPLLGGSQAHMLAMHFGGGVVGIFTHSLPIYRPPNLNLHLWSKPIFIVVMILVGVWQFNRSSRGASRRGALFGPEADVDPGGMFGGGSRLRDRGGERLDPASIEALVQRMKAEDTKMRSQTARGMRGM